MRRILLCLVLIAPGLSGCSAERDGVGEVAEAYVGLALAMERRDPGYVDAYFGPPRWEEAAGGRELSLPEIGARADSLLLRLGRLQPDGPRDTFRFRHLEQRLRALRGRTELLSGARMGFDEESRVLFGTTAPAVSEDSLGPVLHRIDRLLPGEGSPVERLRSLQARVAIPRDRVDAVLRAALEGCRAPTLRHVDLPPEERVEVRYVTRRPWRAYHRYHGDFRSTVEVNTDYPMTVDDALDIACHEAYPGHHVRAVLLERDLVRERGWVEHSLLPLYAPDSFVAEGAAQLAVEVAFPGGERDRFERQVLYPLAGVDPAFAQPLQRVRPLLERLAPVVDEGARRFLDREMDRPTAAAWLERHALLPGAEATLGFVNRYRSYLITYNTGEAAVRRFLDSRGGSPDDPERRWELYLSLISEPRLPSEIAPAGGAPRR